MLIRRNFWVQKVASRIIMCLPQVVTWAMK
jgi:hypothetical protein